MAAVLRDEATSYEQHNARIHEKELPRQLLLLVHNDSIRYEYTHTRACPYS